MKVGYHLGAMYIQIENEEIDPSPVELGDKIIHPGQYVNKLGETGFRDVKIESLEVFDDVKLIALDKQLSIF